MIVIPKANLRKGSEKVSKSGEGWRSKCVWVVSREVEGRFFPFSFFESDFSLLNETAQFNYPKFMGNYSVLSLFYCPALPHLYMTTGETIALT